MKRARIHSREGACLAAGGAVGAAEEHRVVPALAADILRDDEIVILMLRPNPLYIVLGSLQSIAFIIIITMILAYLARKFPSAIPWTDAQAFTLGFILIALRLFWQGLDWWGRLYILTDRRVIRRAGIVRIAIFETALRQIAHTSIFMRMRERLFGLGTIGFATAGSDSYEAFWLMISRPLVVHKTILEAISRYGGGR